MAKKGSSRMRVFFAELEGDDETMQSGLAAIASAVNKTFEPRKVIIHRDGQLALGVGEEELDDEEDIIEGEIAAPLKSNGSAKKKGKAKTPAMKLVKDLNLSPKDKPSLKSFFAEKAPKQQWAQITLFVYYMDKVLEITGITPDHVYTCFNEVGAKKPPNTPQAIRLVAKRQGHVDSRNSENLTVTVHGENFVEKELSTGQDAE